MWRGVKGCDVSEIYTGVEASKGLPDLLLNLLIQPMPPWSRCLMARISPVLTALLLHCVSSVRARAENRVDYRYEDYI